MALPACLRVLCALGLAWLAAGARAADPAAPQEYALKAAFIYNFALFTTWEERADRTISLCVLGRDPFGEALDALQGREVGAARLAVKRMRNVGETAGACQIVFITEAEVDNFIASRNGARDASGVLTIADRDGAARQGIMIEMTMEARKIGFEFNQESARKCQVQISSKLLRLARKVH
ncbi:MAG: YfiR family protein [Pseudomonadota bacterium]